MNDAKEKKKITNDLRQAASWMQGESDRLAHRAKVMKEQSKLIMRRVAEIEDEQSKVENKQDPVVFN